MPRNALGDWFGQLLGEPEKKPRRRSARSASTEESIDVEWRWVRATTDKKWELMGVLYALVHPTDDWIIYLGKADYSTVRQRYKCWRKDWIHGAVSLQGHSKPRLLVGQLMLDDNRRLSSEKLADVESLLIKRIKPVGNQNCRNTRIKRPGLTVECIGSWPVSRMRFHDQ